MYRVLSVVVVFALLIGCKQRDRALMFEVPEGFRGQFEIMEDPKGTPLDWSKDVLVIVVPQDGLVRVKDFRVFASPHSICARWSTGEPLPVQYLFDPPKSGLALRMLGPSRAGRHVYHVGDNADAPETPVNGG